MRLVFMGTPAFAVPTLQALHEAGHDIAAVYTQPPRPAGRGQKERPSPVQQYAEAHGLPVFTPASLKDAYDQQQFTLHDAQIAVVAAYGLLLPPPILNACPLGCINVHPSLLPRWRGAAPIQRTIMAGDAETGVCIMQMDEGLDTGDVLLMEKYPLMDGTTASELHDLLAAMGARLTLQALIGLESGSITPSPQPHDGVTYAKKISKREARIDWSHAAAQVAHHINGLSPSPAAYIELNGESIKVFRAQWQQESKAAQPGTVLDERLLIACATGAVRLLELQKPGKKRMNADEFLRGVAIPAGTVLE